MSFLREGDSITRINALLRTIPMRQDFAVVPVAAIREVKATPAERVVTAEALR